MNLGNRVYIMLLALGGLMFNLALAYAEDIILSGDVRNEQGQTIQQFSVYINGDHRVEGQDGKFRSAVENHDIIAVQVSADGYFPITHTFAISELQSLNGMRIIPPIIITAKKKGRVMLALAGDVMMGRRYIKPRGGELQLIRDGHEAQDTKDIVKYIKPYIENADYALVNLETQLMGKTPEGSAPKSVTFFSPPETVEALAWAGVDYVTLGNNHTFDNLEEGLISTLDILKRSPLGFSGAGLDEEQALEPYRTQISGMPYSFLGYVSWKGSSTPHQVAEGQDKGGAALGTMNNIITNVEREAALNQITVIQLHGSLEYSDEPTLVTEQKLKTAIDQGADLAIAHHPHVVQGFEIYKNKLIAYSLGNFIFDQYFYGAQFSYVLYVWMDEDKFHRAEIVPIYIKGYKPTPAIGQARNMVLKRVATLSARRNIALSYSGGHGVITPITMAKPTKAKLDVSLITAADQDQIISLDQCDASQFVTGLTSARGDIKYRLGMELLRRGDFESFTTFDAPERGWLTQNNQSGVSNEYVYQGQNAFKVSATKGEKISTFGMKVFPSDYKAGNPMSFAGQVFGQKDVKLDFYLQGRPTNGGFSESLKNGPREHLGTVMMKQNAWQQFSVEFDSPRVGFKSYRILVEATSQDGSDLVPVYYDNIALIQWETAYRDTGSGAVIASPNQITHVGLKDRKIPTDKIELLMEKYDGFATTCKLKL